MECQSFQLALKWNNGSGTTAPHCRFRSDVTIGSVNATWALHSVPVHRTQRFAIHPTVHWFRQT